MKTQYITLVSGRPAEKFKDKELSTTRPKGRFIEAVGRLTRGFIVIDFDFHKEDSNPYTNWEEKYQGTEWSLEALKTTCKYSVTTKTGKGTHYYFSVPESVKTRTFTPCPDVDVKGGDNAFVRVYDDLEELPELSEFPNAIEFFKVNEQQPSATSTGTPLYKGMPEEVVHEIQQAIWSGNYKNGKLVAMRQGKLNDQHKAYKSIGYLAGDVAFGFTQETLDRANMTARTKLWSISKTIKQAGFTDEEREELVWKIASKSQDCIREERYITDAIELKYEDTDEVHGDVDFGTFKVTLE